ncbi:MAG: hypothetical protein H6737_04895 [Alphaproteobacteria bacterium]|nr:hypothetical protein [Alphaproteobacteria bacterium]
MRWMLPVCLGLALACGGMGAPKLATVDRSGFTIDLVEGEVETDDDQGAQGDYDVAFGFTTQALSWSPIDAEDTLEDTVDLMWDGMVAIAEAEGSLEMPPKPDVVEGAVDGQRSLGFEADISFATIVSTTWRCPDSGLEITLNTSGLSSAKQAHAEALKTARCKHEPVAVVEGPPSFRFTGDPSQWAEDVESTPAQRVWTRSDDLVTITATSQARLDEEPDDKLCEATMTASMARMGVVTVDPTRSRFRKTAGGCVQDFGGVRFDDGVDLLGRMEHDGCGGRGYFTICIVASGEALDAACPGLVSCL